MFNDVELVHQFIDFFELPDQVCRLSKSSYKRAQELRDLRHGHSDSFHARSAELLQKFASKIGNTKEATGSFGCLDEFGGVTLLEGVDEVASEDPPEHPPLKLPELLCEHSEEGPHISDSVAVTNLDCIDLRVHSAKDDWVIEHQLDRVSGMCCET